MAAAAVAVETLTVALQGREEKLTVLSFMDRRTRPNRRKQWLLIRGLERLLFGVGEGDRSTGAFAAHLGKCSMADAPLCCEKARVDDNTITQQELDAGQQTSPPPPPCLTDRLAPAPREQSSVRCGLLSIRRAATVFARSLSAR